MQAKTDIPFLQSMAASLQRDGARLMGIAMTLEDDDRDSVSRAAEAVLVAYRKCRKHLEQYADIEV